MQEEKVKREKESRAEKMRDKQAFNKIGRDDSEIQDFLKYKESEEKPRYLEPKEFPEEEEEVGRFELSKIFNSILEAVIKGKKWIFIFIGVIVVIVLVAVLFSGGGNNAINPQDVLVRVDQVTTETTIARKEIRAHIVGAVKNPGVYTFESGSRVDDFIKLAGGVVDGAYADILNLAARVNDGEKICVPKKVLEEAEGCEIHKTFESQSSTEPININTANVAQLDSLNGIGPSLAQAIIDYRHKEGEFNSVEELTNISGITSNLISKFIGQITIQ